VWSFDILQVFLSIFKVFNELSSHLLHLYYKFKTKDSGFLMTNSARTGYFQEAFSAAKEIYSQENTSRPSRSIFTGRSGDSQPSFRDSVYERSQVNQNDIKIEQLLPLRGNNVVKKNTGNSIKSKSPIRTSNKENKNNKGNESNRKIILSQRARKSGENTQREMETETTIINDLLYSNQKPKNQRQKSVDVLSHANPGGLRNALKEVDTNYTKKLLRNGTNSNFQGKKPSGIIENIERIEAFSSRKSSVQENITLSTEAFPGTHLPTQPKEMKYASVKVTKPPLKSNANPSIKGKQPNPFMFKMNYESFNPRYHEIPSQATEPEDISPSSVKERDIKASEFLARGKILSNLDESFIDEKGHNDSWIKGSNITEVNKLREMNKHAWQQEKSILENMINGKKNARDFYEEKDEADISIENGEPIPMKINELRRASITSQKSSHFSEDAKAMKNRELMEIFNRLESKIYDGRSRPGSRLDDNSTSRSFVKVRH